MRTPDPFFLQELPWLRRHFDRVILCAASGVAEIVRRTGRRRWPRRGPHSARLRACLQAPFCTVNSGKRSDALRADGRLNAQNALKLWLIYDSRFEAVPLDSGRFATRDEQTTLYAYWMSYDGFAAALCNTERFPCARHRPRARVRYRRTAQSPEPISDETLHGADAGWNLPDQPLRAGSVAFVRGYPPEKAACRRSGVSRRGERHRTLRPRVSRTAYSGWSAAPQ